MIFASKRFLDVDIEDWRIACWEWLLFHLGGVEALKRRALVLPTPAFFPKIEAEVIWRRSWTRRANGWRLRRSS